MANSVDRLITGRDAILAGRSAEWVDAMHSDVTVAFDGHTIRLVSDVRSIDQLVNIWRCAMLNERLVEAGASRRALLLGQLTA